MELRKCECGGDASLEDASDGLCAPIYWIGCWDCFSATKHEFHTQEDAIQAWNEGKVE